VLMSVNAILQQLTLRDAANPHQINDLRCWLVSYLTMPLLFATVVEK